MAGPSTPTGPTVDGDGSGASHVNVVAISPPAGETVAAAKIPTVRVEYVLGSSARDPRVWICLGRTATSVILSSCRDRTVNAPSGTVENYPGIYFTNGKRAVAETGFIASFLVEGDIVERRSNYPPFEIAHDKLTRYIVAHETRPHVWRWADMP